MMKALEPRSSVANDAVNRLGRWEPTERDPNRNRHAWSVFKWRARGLPARWAPAAPFADQSKAPANHSAKSAPAVDWARIDCTKPFVFDPRLASHEVTIPRASAEWSCTSDRHHGAAGVNLARDGKRSTRRSHAGEFP